MRALELQNGVKNKLREKSSELLSCGIAVLARRGPLLQFGVKSRRNPNYARVFPFLLTFLLSTERASMASITAFPSNT